MAVSCVKVFPNQGTASNSSVGRASASSLRRCRPAVCYPDGVFILGIVLHVLTTLAVVLLVLLHSGRGGGLSDMFGGGLGASAAGSTVIERNLDRITVVVAIIFGFVTLGLALMMDT